MEVAYTLWVCEYLKFKQLQSGTGMLSGRTMTSASWFMESFSADGIGVTSTVSPVGVTLSFVRPLQAVAPIVISVTAAKRARDLNIVLPDIT